MSTFPGPRVRTDIVDVYLFARPPQQDGTVSFLQLQRAEEPLAGTWHPVMGHVEPNESAVQCALRELAEEVGLTPSSPDLIGLWALEQVHPFYVASMDAVVMSPRFAAEVRFGWMPNPDSEHSAYRWVRTDDANLFMWPGQRETVLEILDSLLPDNSPNREFLRILPAR